MWWKWLTRSEVNGLAASDGHPASVSEAASDGQTATVVGPYSASDTGLASVATERVEETGSAGGASVKASDGVDVATGKRIMGLRCSFFH